MREGAWRAEDLGSTASYGGMGAASADQILIFQGPLEKLHSKAKDRKGWGFL